MEKSIRLRDKEEAYALFGERDRHLKMIRSHFDVKIFARDNNLRIAGNEQGVLDAYVALLALIEKVRKYGQIRTQDVESSLLRLDSTDGDSNPEIAPLGLQGAKPMTPGQAAYIEAIKSSNVVFGVPRRHRQDLPGDQHGRGGADPRQRKQAGAGAPGG